MAKLKKFRVSISFKCVNYFVVEAATAEEAMEKAEEKRNDGVDPDDYWESSEQVEDAEEVK